MEAVDTKSAGVQLRIELGTGTAIIDGERIDLPLKEFRVLAYLSARPGVAVQPAELISEIWPESPWMTPQDLYNYVYKLRRKIGDPQRDQMVIGNRRRFGYFLDLPQDHVKIIGSASDATPAPHVEAAPEPEPATEPIVLDERPVPLVAIDEQPPQFEAPIPRTQPTRRTIRPGRRTLAALAAVLATALLATAWSATRDLTPTPDGPDDIVVRAPERSVADKSDRADGKERAVSGSRPRPDNGQAGPTSGGQVAAAPASAGGMTTDSGAAASENTRTERTDTTEQLPPPPTRFLYHLVNQETGNHFVTTDPAESSEREAAGYTGGAIAKVYMEKQPGTKPISTDHGRAYVFIDADPETSPRTDMAPLWFVSDGAGDFFYVTNQADIPRDGWSSSLIGYVGAQ